MNETQIEKIAKWLPAIYEAREALGVTADQYPDALLLGLITVESAGDPFAHRTGSGFYGLLQIGRGYAIDASEKLGIDRVPPESLLGDGLLAIKLTIAYFERYKSRTGGDPIRNAAMHKGGAGSARMLSDRLARGPREEALLAAIDHVEKTSGVPRLRLYVDRYIEAAAFWEGWLKDQDLEYLALACYEKIDDKEDTEAQV